MQPKMTLVLLLVALPFGTWPGQSEKSIPAMAANGLECIRSSSLLTVDQLPASSHACIVPSPIANSLSVASAGLDGQIRLVQFEDGPAASTEASMDQTSAIINKYVLNILVALALYHASSTGGPFGTSSENSCLMLELPTDPSG